MLDAFLSRARAGGDPAQLALALRSHDASLLQASPAALCDTLRGLNPAQHTLGFLHVLDALGRAGPAGQVNDTFIQAATSLLQTCSRWDVRLAPDRFVSCFRKLKEHYLSANMPRRAILLLQQAVRVLQPSTAHLTPLHADFLQCCMQAKCYGAATEILEQEIFDLDPNHTGLSASDFFLHCYYGGMIHTGRKRYAEALELFLHAITAPAVVVSAVAVAAYKKYMLVSLIHSGSMQALPKYTASPVLRCLKADCAPYADLSAAYAGSDEELNKVLNQHQAIYREDGNLGLVSLAQTARTTRAIQKLTQTYLTLSLADIAGSVGLASAEQAEQHILRRGPPLYELMIDGGDIVAEINGAANMVHFKDDPESYTSAEVVRTIDAQIQSSIALAGRLQALNCAVSCDRSYLTKMHFKECQPRFEDPTDFGAEQMAYTFQA